MIILIKTPQAYEVRNQDHFLLGTFPPTHQGYNEARAYITQLQLFKLVEPA
jgi:hypothetical protein